MTTNNRRAEEIAEAMSRLEDMELEDEPSPKLSGAIEDGKWKEKNK